MAVVRRYRARRPAELDPLIVWLHDAFYSVGEIDFDEEAGVLTAPFEQEAVEDGFPDHELVRRGLLARIYREPYFRCQLIVRAAREVRPRLEELTEPGMFEEITYDSDRRLVKLKGLDHAAFAVAVTELDVEIEVTDEIVCYRRRAIGRLWPWDSTGRKL